MIPYFIVDYVLTSDDARIKEMDRDNLKVIIQRSWTCLIKYYKN